MSSLSLANRLARSFRLLARRVPHPRVIAQLGQLDDRLLDDIGLSRLKVEQMRRHW